MRKIRRWSEREVAFLKENYLKLPLKELVEKLDRHRNSIYSKLRELNLWGLYSQRFESLDLSEAELAYLAGFIDGEGCITVRVKYLNGKLVGLIPVLEIANTNEEVIE